MAAKLTVAGLAICLTWALPSAAQNTPPGQQQDQQKPAPNPPAEGNPFPDSTNNVPVLPSATGAPAAAPAYTSTPPVLPSDGTDPVRSPDDPAGGAAPSSEWSDSASAVPMDRIEPPPAPDEPVDRTRKGRHKGDDQLGQPDVPKESAKKDESVGSLYLDEHDWKGALSRYESAVVLDPYNPDVYWGMAESQRHLGQFAAAKSNYQKVMEYDPDSRHAKDAKKILKEPDMANATTAAAPQH